MSLFLNSDNIPKCRAVFMNDEFNQKKKKRVFYVLRLLTEQFPLKAQFLLSTVPGKQWAPASCEVSWLENCRLEGVWLREAGGRR